MKKVSEQQSELTLTGIQKSYENCDSYIFKKKEVLLGKPLYLGLAFLDSSKLMMCEK